MKKYQHNWTAWLLSFCATLAVLLSGCASPKEHSFNEDFGEALPTDPKYYVEDVDATHFKIVVHQGKFSNGAERLINVKQAATNIAKAESQRRGWEKWQLNYIQEHDQGWMHVVIGEVTREKYGAPQFSPRRKSPVKTALPNSDSFVGSL